MVRKLEMLPLAGSSMHVEPRQIVLSGIIHQKFVVTMLFGSHVRNMKIKTTFLLTRMKNHFLIRTKHCLYVRTKTNILRRTTNLVLTRTKNWFLMGTKNCFLRTKNFHLTKTKTHLACTKRSC